MASSTMCFSSLAGRSALVSSSRRQQQASRPSRQLVRVAAESDPKFSFDSNKRAAVGYTEEDSAGQSNIFAVEPKTYVAGSAADDTSSGATVTVAAVGFVVAMALGAVGLLVNSGPSDVKDVAPTGEYLALSEYSAKFKAELGSGAAAAAAAVAEAPALSE